MQERLRDSFNRKNIEMAGFQQSRYARYVHWFEDRRKLFNRGARVQ